MSETATPALVWMDATASIFDAPSPERLARGWVKMLVEEGDKGDTYGISIQDVIGLWGTPVDEVVEKILQAEADDTIEVVLNSPGGDADGGIAIYNALSESPATVKVRIIGAAASAASLIPLAADEAVISPAAFVMIHLPETFADGTARQLARRAEIMADFEETVIGIYVEETGQSEEQIREWMEAETYFTGQKAVDAGFVTALSRKVSMQRPHWPVTMMGKNLPSKLKKAMLSAPKSDDEEDGKAGKGKKPTASEKRMAAKAAARARMKAEEADDEDEVDEALETDGEISFDVEIGGESYQLTGSAAALAAVMKLAAGKTMKAGKGKDATVEITESQEILLDLATKMGSRSMVEKAIAAGKSDADLKAIIRKANTMRSEVVPAADSTREPAEEAAPKVKMSQRQRLQAAGKDYYGGKQK